MCECFSDLQPHCNDCSLSPRHQTPASSVSGIGTEKCHCEQSARADLRYGQAASACQCQCQCRDSKWHRVALRSPSQVHLTRETEIQALQILVKSLFPKKKTVCLIAQNLIFIVNQNSKATRESDHRIGNEKGREINIKKIPTHTRTHTHTLIHHENQSASLRIPRSEPP